MVKAYWWVGENMPNPPLYNFGDMLSPLLLKRFAGISPVWSPASEAEIISTGSVLEKLPEGWDGYILGTGKLFQKTAPDLSKAKVLAVRGPLTARDLHLNCALGDPGLLAPELVTVEDKKFDLGIIPHFLDRKLATDPRFTSSTAYSHTVIDPLGDPLDVVRRIGECRKIVSSSLHGLILADAFGIPRRFEYAPHFDKEGGTFKFRDYNASVGVPFEVGKVQTAPRHMVEDRQSELFDAFYYLGAIFRSRP